MFGHITTYKLVIKQSLTIIQLPVFNKRAVWNREGLITFDIYVSIKIRLHDKASNV